MRTKTPSFTSAAELAALVEIYFKPGDSENEAGTDAVKCAPKKKPATAKIKHNEEASSTISGLALHLGFTSIKSLEMYEKKGKFGDVIAHARLRIEEAYEKKLHFHSSTGAVFALKNMGWGDRTENENAKTKSLLLKIQIMETGPKPVSSEKEVVL